LYPSIRRRNNRYQISNNCPSQQHLLTTKLQRHSLACCRLCPARPTVSKIASTLSDSQILLRSRTSVIASSTMHQCVGIGPNHLSTDHRESVPAAPCMCAPCTTHCVGSPAWVDLSSPHQATGFYEDQLSGVYHRAGAIATSQSYVFLARSDTRLLGVHHIALYVLFSTHYPIPTHYTSHTTHSSLPKTPRITTHYPLHSVHDTPNTAHYSVPHTIHYTLHTIYNLLFTIYYSVFTS
jgi:hypothetical protein